MKKKIFTVVGARPQFIKAAAVSRVIKGTTGINEYLVHTGQHYDFNMSEVFFNDLNIPRPDINLQVGSGGHGLQTGEMLKLIEEELLKVRPDLLLVYGDTNSTLAGALAAAKLHIPVAHVEAGLRSFNRKMPEEVNRVLTDHISDILFAPTEGAVQNLKHEGIDPGKIRLVGDVMFDTVRYYGPFAENKQHLLAGLALEDEPYIFATIHRAENTNDKERLLAILNQLDTLAKDIKIIFPVHPRTKSFLNEMNYRFSSDRIIILDPQGYLETLLLQRKSALVITDSGGVQKEAFLNKRYCITVRPETEWAELVDAGYNYLADPIEKLSSLVLSVLKKEFAVRPDFQPYGSGFASENIIETIKEYLQ